MEASLPVSFLQIDSNLSQLRIKNLPLNETISTEMEYIKTINADVIIHRESNRRIEIDNEKQPWEKIYDKYFPSYTCLKERAIKGDQSENAFGILILVRSTHLHRIKVEIHDITATPTDGQSLPKFAENKVALIFLDNKPVYIAWHAWLARTLDTIWVWESECHQIIELITKYRNKTENPSLINHIDLVSDANMIHPEQITVWRKLQTNLGFQYSYGTNQEQHLSFYGLNHDFVPKKDIRNPSHFGYVDSKIENGEEYIVPISSIDGVLSHRSFKIIYPDIDYIQGKLKPCYLSNTEFDNSTWMKIKQGFKNVHNMNKEYKKNGENRICGFDHIAFLIEIIK